MALAAGPVVGLSMTDIVQIGHEANRDPRVVKAREAFEGRFEVPANETDRAYYLVACETYYRVRSEVRKELATKLLEERRKQND